ncbi:MAG: pili assembly chaperone [Planctomycetes bacterium]|nr:pili assembly chaperone [Planctomycetota bacterium]
MYQKRKNEGFTLIELMIVVAIIAIIAAIAIPNLLNAKMAGNEASAVSSLRTLSTVCEQFRNRNLDGDYPVTLAELSAGNYLDTSLATATDNTTLKSGYWYTFSGDGNTWNCVASPGTFDSDGGFHYFVSPAGVIYRSDAVAAPAVGDSAWIPIQ